MATSKQAKSEQQPTGTVIATLHLPMLVSEFARFCTSIEQIWPSALVRVTDDSARPEVVVPEVSEPEVSATEQGLALELLGELLRDSLLSDLADSGLEHGILTEVEHGDVIGLRDRATDLLGFRATGDADDEGAAE